MMDARRDALPDPRAEARERRFQADLLRALLAPADAPPAGLDPDVAVLLGQPAFAVHRNTCLRGCIDALRAAFPAVRGAIGEAAFDRLALAHVRAAPPRTPRLHDYGAAFADFVARDPDAADRPWLAEVARLDRLWLDAHLAADAACADPAAWAACPPETLGAMRPAPHPAARWVRSDSRPAVSLWRASRDTDPVRDAPPVDAAAIDGRGEAVLLTRPADAVLATPVDAATVALLDACARGASLGEAAAAALEADPAADLAAVLSCLLRVGAFARVPGPPAPSA